MFGRTQGQSGTGQGISTVICGPGSIARAHKADEFVAVEQLGQCLEMIGRLVAKLER